MNSDEIFADIGKLFPKYKERQPNDLDFHDIMKYYGVGQSTAHSHMDEFVKSGKYCYVKVKDDVGNPIRVIRRI
jgi:deoxyribodipyrimidine photolyase